MPRLNLTEDETRSLILDHADRLFSEIGYDKTTVADIARACGFSSSNVHRVFGTKAVINRAIAGRKLAGKLQRACTAAEEEETAADRLRVFYETIFSLNRAMFSEHKRVHHMVACAIDERWEEVQQHRGNLLAQAREIVAYGVERREFHVTDIEAAARALHMSSMRFCHPLAAAEMEGEPDDVPFPAWIDFVLASLGRRR